MVGGLMVAQTAPTAPPTKAPKVINACRLGRASSTSPRKALPTPLPVSVSSAAQYSPTSAAPWRPGAGRGRLGGMTRRRLMLVVSVLALAAGVLAALFFIGTFGDGAAEWAVARLQPGLTAAEARRVLADVWYADLVKDGDGRLLIDVPGGWVAVEVTGGRVAAVERVPYTGPVWRRLVLTWDRNRRAWEHYWRNRHSAPAD